MDCLNIIPVIILIIIISSSHMLTTFAQNPPRPVSRTKEIERKLAVPVGSQASLPCPVEIHDTLEGENVGSEDEEEEEDEDESDHLYIDWYKDGSSLNIFDNRFRKTKSGSLRIKDTRLTDSGQYKCQAVNGFGAVEMYIQLIVFDENGLSIQSSTTTTTTTTTSTTTTIPPEVDRIAEYPVTSFPADPLDPLLSTINSYNPSILSPSSSSSSLEPKIFDSTIKSVDGSDLWLDKLSLPFIVASIGAIFLVLIILLLLLSYIKLRSTINPKFNQVIDRPAGLFGPTINHNDLNHEQRQYNMYPINVSNQSTPGHLHHHPNYSGLTPTPPPPPPTKTTPSHQHRHLYHHISSPPRQPPLPPPPPPTIPLPHHPGTINQLTPSHFTFISTSNAHELRTGSNSDKADSTVDSSAIYESPLEFDLKPNFPMKTPYGYLC